MLGSFERETGNHPVRLEDPHSIPYGGDVPVFGVSVGDTRYLGDVAQASKREHNKPAVMIWDRREKKDATHWTDVDSVIRLRSGSSK